MSFEPPSVPPSPLDPPSPPAAPPPVGEIDTALFLQGVAIVVTLGAFVALCFWATRTRPSKRHFFVMPDKLDASPLMIAEATRYRAVIMLDRAKQAKDLEKYTLVYAAAANALMASGLTLSEANQRLQVQKNEDLYSFVPLDDASVETQGLLNN